jgi:predicted class III extradiol MEMO1 family dioxygenase
VSIGRTQPTAVYAASNTNTFIGAIQLDGLLQLTLQLAADISVQADKTANYDEYSVTPLLKYFFEPREGLFRRICEIYESRRG